MDYNAWDAPDDRAWVRADQSNREADMLGQGISYLACDVDGIRYIAPLGSPRPRAGVEVETVIAYLA